jgi:hypothetical protein
MVLPLVISLVFISCVTCDIAKRPLKVKHFNSSPSRGYRFTNPLVLEQVVTVGGGASGLTATTELIKRGYEVVILERSSILGGKLKAYETPEGLPMEHGFHFFDAIYRNMPATLAEIPYKGSTLYNQLTVPREVGIGYPGKAIVSPARVFDTPQEYRQWLESMNEQFKLGLTKQEFEYYWARVMRYLFISSFLFFLFIVLISLCLISFWSSCDGRRHDQFANMTYGEAIAPGGRQCWSDAYWSFFVCVIH